jgi:hypothetical protein
LSPILTAGKKFTLGTTVIQPEVKETLSQLDVEFGLRRHQRCDWGDISDEVRRDNENNLARRGRLVSVYYSMRGIKFCIVSDLHVSKTTVLLSDRS